MRPLLLILLLLGCPNPPAPCDAFTCQGCCTFTSPSDPGTCRPGNATAACGAGGTTCQVCEASLFCSHLGVCRGEDEPFPPNAKFVFATSLTFMGDFGGLDGGDATCQALAADAGLPGSYLAYLSDVPPSGTPITAASRFTGNGPWVMRTRDARGKVLHPFDSRAELFAPPRSPIDQDETGHVFTFAEKRHVWTGTLVDGGTEIPMPNRGTTCDRWTSTTTSGIYGIIDVPTDKWTGLGAVSCASDNRLYCFQQAP